MNICILYQLSALVKSEGMLDKISEFHISLFVQNDFVFGLIFWIRSVKITSM